MKDILMISRLEFEKRLWDQGFKRVMGLDEVGRGCLSGPVAAAGVIFEPGSFPEGIRDSKSLGQRERERLAEEIKEKAVFWTIQQCSVKEIDQLNILWASMKAMQKCAETSGADPDYLLVDGNRFGSNVIPHICLVNGDNRSLSIGAASILAKVKRDRLMRNLHEEYPHYGWDSNVGYPTSKHFQGLEKYGITRHHRRSFNLRTTKEYSG